MAKKKGSKKPSAVAPSSNNNGASDHKKKTPPPTSPVTNPNYDADRSSGVSSNSDQEGDDDDDDADTTHTRVNDNNNNNNNNNNNGDEDEEGDDDDDSSEDEMVLAEGAGWGEVDSDSNDSDDDDGATNNNNAATQKKSKKRSPPPSAAPYEFLLEEMAPHFTMSINTLLGTSPMYAPHATLAEAVTDQVSVGTVVAQPVSAAGATKRKVSQGPHAHARQVNRKHEDARAMVCNTPFLTSRRPGFCFHRVFRRGPRSRSTRWTCLRIRTTGGSSLSARF